MAESRKEFKSLICPFHPGEQIICLSKNPSDKKLLYCVHCVLQADTASKNSMSPILSAIEEVYSMLYSKERLVVDDSALDPLLETLDTKSFAVNKLTEHIANEKERVEKELDRLVSDITQIVKDTKANIFRQLDRQVDILKENYAVYRQKLKKFSDFDSGSRKISSLEEFSADLDKCTSSDIFEQLWRDLLDDLREYNMYSVYGNKAQRVLADKLEEYKMMVQAGNKVYPKSLWGTGFYYNEIKDDFTKMFKNLLFRQNKLDSQILTHEEFMKSINLTASLDSHILRKHDLPVLEQVSNCPIYNISLEFRASKDMTDLNIAKKIFQENNDAMMLVKTTTGQVVGYRRTMVKEGGPKSNKVVPKAVVFSLSDQVTRIDEDVGNQGQGQNPFGSIFSGGGNNSNGQAWPSKYLNVPNPVELLKENGFMQIVPTLDEKGYFSKTFSAREVEVFRFL